MIDKYNDNYTEVNYTRLFLLFALFLVSLYFRIWWAAETYVSAWYETDVTTAECLLAWLSTDCDVKEESLIWM
jgi:hypothetical protein